MTWTETGAVRGLVMRYPLATAFVISLAVHTAFFGFWKLGKQLHWWEHQATWLLALQKAKRALPFAKVQPLTPPKQQQIPLTFVEVDPATATKEAPKDAKFYSAQNSKAANPDATLDLAAPKVDGEQNKVVRLENVPKPGPQPLQPAIAPEKIAEEPKPKPTDTIGDLAKVKPAELKKPNNGVAEIASDAPPPPVEKPRTLAAARARKQMLAGERMKQDGGVRRPGHVALDAIATPFGSYDAAFIAAVQQRWYDLLDTQQFAQRSGKVVLEFHLLYDGRITEMKMMDNEVGEVLGLICERAIKDPAPYGKWPDDMRRMVEKPYREVKFTFYYY